MVSISFAEIFIDSLEPKVKTDVSTLVKVGWNISAEPVPAMLKVYRRPDLYKHEADRVVEARHRHIVELYGVIQDSKWKGALLFEYMSEGDLGTYLNNEDPTELERSYIARDIISAVVYLTLVQMVHRDITCSNVMLTKTKGDLFAKLGDFGIARKYNEGDAGFRSTAFEPAGTPGYIAPELFCFNKETGPCLYKPESDIYGLGMVLLFLGSKNLTDPYPYSTHEEKLALNTAHVMPDISEEVSPFTRAMFLSCFELDPKKRIDAPTLLRKYKAEITNEIVKRRCC